MRKLMYILAGAAAALAIAAPASAPAWADGLTVLPVTIELAPGQTVAAIRVINQGDAKTAFQVRGFAWSQPGGADQLLPTDAFLASPPMGAIDPGATQVVRVMVRAGPQAQEATYRILLDQIPPAAAPGNVRIALRLSIPVFAEPAAHAAPHLQWSLQSAGREAVLVAVNDGQRHETVRDIALSTSDGRPLQVEANLSPYVLPGATRRWRVTSAPAPGGTVRLTAHADSGPIDQPIVVK
jgi:fimbrial chaperone protein